MGSLSPIPCDTKWSYAKLDANGMVECVKEKEVISDLATTGVYYWSRAGDFIKYADEMIAANERVNGEFYVCPVYNWAIKDGKSVKVVKCKKMWGLCVPEDLEIFKRDKMQVI